MQSAAGSENRLNPKLRVAAGNPTGVAIRSRFGEPAELYEKHLLPHDAEVLQSAAGSENRLNYRAAPHKWRG